MIMLYRNIKQEEKGVTHLYPEVTGICTKPEGGEGGDLVDPQRKSLLGRESGEDKDLRPEFGTF